MTLKCKVSFWVKWDQYLFGMNFQLQVHTINHQWCTSSHFIIQCSRIYDMYLVLQRGLYQVSNAEKVGSIIFVGHFIAQVVSHRLLASSAVHAKFLVEKWHLSRSLSKYFSSPMPLIDIQYSSYHNEGGGACCHHYYYTTRGRFANLYLLRLAVMLHYEQ
jgi:hypothetical protein